MRGHTDSHTMRLPLFLAPSPALCRVTGGAELLTKCQPPPDPEHLRPGMPGQHGSDKYDDKPDRTTGEDHDL